MRFERKVLWAVLAIVTLSGCDLSPQAKEARFLQKGKKEFDRQNYAVAILHFKNAAAARPFDAEPYYQLGLTHAAINDFKSATAELTKATFIDPKHVGAQLKLAELLSNSRLKETVEEAQKHAKAVLGVAAGQSRRFRRPRGDGTEVGQAGERPIVRRAGGQ